jgi:hypothetical protein
MPPEMETPAPVQEEIQQETQAPEPAAEEAAQAAPVAVEPVAQTEEPEASPVATQEPEPPHKEEEGSPSFDPDLVSRLGELESKIKDYESREVKRAEEDRQQAERSREGLLEEFGILDPMYSRLAPSISEADPRTPEGKEVIRQWMTKHPNLFKKSPTLEKITDGSTKEVRQGFGKKLSFGDAIRKLRG